MLGFMKGLFGGGEGAHSQMLTTTRTDWEVLNREIFTRVIEGGKFCIGIVSSGDAEPGQMKFRMSLDYPGKEAIEYIRSQFKPAQFESIMTSRSGLASVGKFGLFKVVSDKLGLPRNAMVLLITNSSNPELKSVLLFGGEFLDNHMAARMHSLEDLLGRAERASGDKPVGRGGPSRNELVAMLEEIDVKRLFDYEIAQLAEIANGLDDSKGQLSKRLKPKFWAVSQYLMKKRLN